MWKYYNPVEVVFGTGKLDELGQLMAERGLDRALVVSDPFTHRSGVAARLKECAGGRVLDIISEVEPNPTCDNVDACARREDLMLEHAFRVGFSTAVRLLVESFAER